MLGGLEGCTCWVPVYDVAQVDPAPGDLEPRAAMCGDCAFRPGSPERADEWTREALYDLAEPGRPAFFCHDGMRRPVAWRHPAGPEVPGHPDDWQPPIRAGVPYRADGRPGLLCAGWTAVRVARLAERSDEAGEAC